MLQDNICAYEASLSIKAKDKPSYMKPARWCAEFFDARGVEAPSAEDWSAFADYVREEYLKENGKPISDKTLRHNYVNRAKKFIAFCTGAELEPVKQDTPPVRVNFMLDAPTYEMLSVLAILEHRTLTAIMKDAAAMYIKEHSEQAGILSAAFEQARRC